MVTKITTAPVADRVARNAAKRAKERKRRRATKEFKRLAMNAKLRAADKRKWIAALESGDYAQGSGSLCEVTADAQGYADYRWCCLGVACDVLVDGDWEISRDWGNGWKWENGGASECTISKKADSCFPYCSTAESWFTSKSVDVDGILQELANLNDSGATFKTIIKLIRENL